MYIVDGKNVESKGVSSLVWEDDTFFKVNFLGKTYNGEIVENNIEHQSLVVKINQRQFEISKAHPLDSLIKALGLDKKKVKLLSQLNSPMPGRVINYAVNPGDKVEEGTPLLTLEAMKMENVIKAEGEGIVKRLEVESGSVVDKGQLIITFE